MCWYSAEHAGKVSQAEAGQRLGLRKVHGFTWAVRECDLESRSPEPVCLVDATRVLFRLAEGQQESLQLPAEAGATFRMLKYPKRDVFEFADGRAVEVNRMPPGLVFDVMVIPGQEDLSGAFAEVPEDPRQEELVATGPLDVGRPSLIRRILDRI